VQCHSKSVPFTKILHENPYKVTTVHEFLHVDFSRRINYCNCLGNNFNDDKILDLTLFSDEIRFHMSGNINSQNFRIESTENTQIIVETQLHPQKFGVWCNIYI
jgi:hypothetical protein